MRARAKISLRAKLLLASSLLLVLPYAGYRFVNELEHTLRQGFEESLLGAARGAAAALAERPELLPGAASSRDVLAHPLPHPLQPDG